MSKLQQGDIVVTGASGGIGSAIVRACVQRGYRVTAVCKDVLTKPAREVDAIPDSDAITYESADFSNIKEVEALAQRLTSRVPSILWLIHAAGYIDPRGATESVQNNFQINAFAPIALSNALANSVPDGGGFVFITSTAGIWGSPASPIYSASKSALQGFAFAFQKIIGPRRRSLVIAPGPTNTAMRESIANDAAQHQDTNTVAAHILQIMETPDTLGDQKLFVIRNGTTETIQVEPTVHPITA